MPGKYKAYPEYKDSGSRWLGDVPKDWSLIPLKYLSQFSGGGTPSKDNPEYWNGNIPWVSPKDMKNSRITSTIDNITKSALKQSSTKLLSEGALLIVVRSGILQHSIPVAINDVPVTLNQDMKAIRLNNRLSAQYAIYVIIGRQSALLLEWRKQGATVESIEQEYLANTVFPVPSLKEQDGITKFLDQETAKIDTLIQKQLQLVQLLKEKHQAVISHAVTKGINPKAKMRESGVEWLGTVPESWLVCRIKQVARLESGHTPDKKVEAYWVDCDIPWVSLNDSSQLKEVDYISDTAIYLNEKGIANSSARKLPERCVVFTRDASIGLAAITTRVMAVSQHVIAWICNEEKVIPEYLLLVFYAMKDELERYTFGATLKTIGMPDVNKLTAAFPNIEEQKQIVEHIFKARKKFDLLIAKAEGAIKIIKERRTALISAAITGKIDVRDWGMPQESKTYKEVVA